MARTYDGVDLSPGNLEQAWRLVQPAYTSYAKLGPNALACAEGDLLGELLGVCQACESAIVELTESEYPSLKAWPNLRIARHLAKAAIAKSKGETPCAT